MEAAREISRSAAATIALSVLLSACARPGAVEPAPPAPMPAAGREEEPRVRSSDAPRPAEAAPCSDELGARLAKPSCDGESIRVAHPIELHPSRAVPREPSKGVLDAVAQLMHDEPGLLLVRIEVRPTAPVRDDPQSQRRQILAAQQRADAVLQYLWRKRGVSAERLEAVGYPFDPKRAPSSGAWHVSLRVVQRAPEP